MAVGFIRGLYIIIIIIIIIICGADLRFKATLVIIYYTRADGKYNLQMEISAAPLARTRRSAATINFIVYMWPFSRGVAIIVKRRRTASATHTPSVKKTNSKNNDIIV
jgi:hypothetical protein